MGNSKERTTTKVLLGAEKCDTAAELEKLQGPHGRLGVGAEAILSKYPDEELYPSPLSLLTPNVAIMVVVPLSAPMVSAPVPGRGRPART